MKRIALCLLLLAALVAFAGDKAKPTTPPPAAPAAAPKYTPTELQKAHLETQHERALRALEAKNRAIADQQRAEAEYNGIMAAYATEAQNVKVENGWPDDVGFDFDKMTFTPAPPKKEEPKPAEKPAEPKAEPKK